MFGRHRDLTEIVKRNLKQIKPFMYKPGTIYNICPFHNKLYM